MRNHHARRAPTILAGVLFLLLPALAAPAAPQYDEYGGSDRYGDETAGYDTAYSYLRVLDGSATLIQAGDYASDGERVQAEVNQPVLAGDRLWVAPRSRAEVLLSDGNLLRLDGETEAAFESLAFSPESGDRVTTLRLLRGNAQLVVTTDSLGDQLPRLDTPNATVYPQEFGVYRVTTDGVEWTEVVVRRGRAEIVGGRDALTVNADQRGLVEGRDRPWAEIRAAAGYDGLERWAADLDRAGRYDSPDIGEDLRYAAAPLERYGRWVDVGGTRAWYPRVDAGWRPYWHGRWSHTPAGLIWISSEPWGWVPYHYGTWDYAPAYGWVWFPGRRFAPAWVYWHWGSSHVAWVPVGYYTRHYRHHYPGFRFGVYGWAGGDSGFFSDWVFCDRRYFGLRHQPHHVFRGHDWGRRHGGHAVPRGILTTDTRRLNPGLWRDGDDAIRALRTRPGVGGRTAVAENLPDVTPFIARRGGGALPAEVVKRVAVTRGDVDRVAGTPLAPGTTAPPRKVAVARPGGGRIEADRERDGGGSPRRAVGVTRSAPEVGGARPGSADVQERPSDRSGPAGSDSDSARRVAVPRGARPRDDAGAADTPRGEAPGARAVRPRADAPRGNDDDPDGNARGKTPRSVVQPRADSRDGDSGGSARRTVQPRADKPREDAARGSTPRAARPRADEPRDDDGGNDDARSDTRRSVQPRAADPRDGAVGGDARTRRAPRPAGSAAGLRADRPDTGRDAPALRQPERRAPAPTAGSSAPRSAPGKAPSADRPTRRAPAPTVRPSAPRSAPGNAPSADRPTRRAPAPSAGRSAPRSAPTARQSAPRQAPTARGSAPPPRSAPSASQSAPRRAPGASQPAPRQSAPRASTPGSGDRRPSASAGESRGGGRRSGNARGDRGGSGGAARPRGDRDRG
jgi:hypothetical protein